MRVILNSDVLHMTRLLAAGLASHIDSFCREAAQSGAVLVIPRTVLLENHRHQAQLRCDLLTKLEGAATLLSKWGVNVPPCDFQTMIMESDLIKTLRETGISVEVEDPTLEDYQDAERRASLHLAPLAPNAKSDEMRDLVIWAVALRISKRDGAGLLISRDGIHLDERVSEEAKAANLLRAGGWDAALEHLGRSGPAGSIIRAVFDIVWKDLRGLGLPLPEEVPSRRFLRPQFSADPDGRAEVRVHFELKTDKGLLSGDAHVFQSTSQTVHTDLTDMKIDDLKWEAGSVSLSVHGELPQLAAPADARMAELRSVIEGS